MPPSGACRIAPEFASVPPQIGALRYVNSQRQLAGALLSYMPVSLSKVVTNMSHDDLHLAYLSRLAPQCDYSVFSAISRSARARNAQAGIAGVLLFDGERFFQWMYGRPEAVTAMMSTIALDRRHTGLSFRLETLLPAGDHDRTWRAGFVDAQAMDQVAATGHGEGQQLLHAIARLIEDADLEAPVAVAALAAPPARSRCGAG